MSKRWVIGGIWLILLMGSREARSQITAPLPQIVISDVIVAGNQRMSAERIKENMRTQPGKVYDAAAVDDDVRTLYKTNQFSNITTLLQEDGGGGAKIYFSVREMPNLVKKISFQGAKHIKEEALRNLVGLKPGMPVNPRINLEGCGEIVAKYEAMGRPLTQCTLVKGGNLADTEVVYQITEGPKVPVRDLPSTSDALWRNYRIGEIHVTGNKRISSESILAHIPLTPGQIVSPADLDKAEKTLAKLGLFVVDDATGDRPTIAAILSREVRWRIDLLVTVKEKSKSRRVGAR